MSGQSIEFANRAYELDLICKPGAPRFILIDGAAGYGKTYLLRKIKETYENERKGWKAALIDLRNSPTMVSQDCSIAWPCIANAIIQPLAQAQSNVPTVTEGVSGVTITNILVPFLVRQRAHILLLFDSVEVLPTDTSAWLKHLVYDLDRGLQLQRERRELRVVFAGRYAGDWGRGAPYALTTRLLSPFDQATVRTMVEQMASEADTQLLPDYLDDLAWWVLHISGGHPRGICHMLRAVAAADFVFVDLESAFLETQFQINGQSGTLFELCVRPIIKELLQSVEDPLLSKVLATISPIRRFDGELLDILLDENIIAISEYKSSWDLVRALLQTHLISPPTDNPMFSDQIVRRMLAMQMQIQDHKRWGQINKCAQEIFHHWAVGSDSAKADIRRVAILESLYHSLQLEPRQTPPEVVQQEITRRLEEYLEGMQDLSSIFQLKYALNQDPELNDLIVRRAGSAAVQALLDEIDRHLPQQK